MSALNLSPRLFRTYEVAENGTCNCLVWEAARATSAAPTFFKRIEIGEPGGIKEPFIDGGVGRNNPTNCVLEEAEMTFPGREITCLVSIGCGQPKTAGIGPRPSFYHRVIPTHYWSVVKALKYIATDCENTAQEVSKKFRTKPNIYFRFNVEQGMQTIEMSEYQDLDKIAAHTQAYLRREENSRRVDAVVRKLVEQGRRSNSNGMCFDRMIVDRAYLLSIWI